MPEAGVSARPARRYAAPWWEELDRDAFRFPAARESREVAWESRDLGPLQRPARAVREPDAQPAPVAAVPPGAAPANGERRTVTIRGHGAERNLPVARPALRRHERPGFQPERAALWAVLLGLCLILVAVASAHG
jgi:hypothetical protein